MTLPRNKPAVDVAAQCFLNALIRETNDWTLAIDDETGNREIAIPVDGSQALHLVVSYHSPTQHHRFSFPAWRVTPDSREPVEFAALVRLLGEKLQRQQGLSTTSVDVFCQRVLRSYVHTHHAVEARHDWAALRDARLTFPRAEQAMLVGHAFHPAPRSHEPFSVNEARRYLPDFAPTFPLRWFAVEHEQVAGESLRFSLRERLRRFATENAPQLLDGLGDGRWLFPLHPWQAEHLLQQPWCRQLTEQGRITDLGEAGAVWLPTSSCRSLYCPTSRDLVKFSLSVRLTNSIRTMSVKEVKRGMRLARLAQTPRWQDLQARFPAFRVMHEDAWAGLRDAEGTLREESLFALRDNLLFGNGTSQTNVLVSLTQAAPDGGDSLLVAAVRRLAARLRLTPRVAAHVWVQAYCDQVLAPLFVAEADYGVVLLAHQQNILVEMQQDLPVGFIYRDCQGSVFSPHAGDWLDEIGEADAENVLSHERVVAYFPYYLMVNSTLAVTAALAAAGLESEQTLMHRVRRTLETLRNGVMRRALLDYVLDSPRWNVKGNFFCYLRGHNENTIAEPAVIYNSMTNPLSLQEIS